MSCLQGWFVGIFWNKFWLRFCAKIVEHGGW